MPDALHFNGPQQWCDRTEEARVLAQQMNDDLSKKMMLGIAEDYDKLAASASLRLAGKAGSPQKASIFSGGLVCAPPSVLSLDRTVASRCMSALHHTPHGRPRRNSGN